MSLKTLREELTVRYAERAAKAVFGEVEEPNTLITLNTQPLSEVVPIEQIELMKRLRDGQVWLTEFNAKLEAKGLIDTNQNDRLARGFDLWGSIERLLRFTYDYSGCIHGEDARCPRNAVCICDYCVSYRAREGETRLE
jgi:hypothetical protein